jgi:DNA-binding NarL/FixJ family response regulator
MMNPSISSNNNEMPSTDHPQRVMIVDDHELFRHGLRDLINSIEGFQVIAEAHFGKEALALAKQKRIDLVVLDMYLPDGDGIQVTRQLRQQVTPPPNVIILSAFMRDETLVDAILAGASGYLTKDMSAGDIAKSLKGVKRGELALPGVVATHLVHLLVQKYTQPGAEVTTNQQVPLTINTSPYQTDEMNQPGSSPNTATPTLTPQEAKVFQLLRHGQSNKQIARHLSISHYTVGKHVQNILHKLGVANRTQAASYTSFEGDTDHSR